MSDKVLEDEITGLRFLLLSEKHTSIHPNRISKTYPEPLTVHSFLLFVLSY